MPLCYVGYELNLDCFIGVSCSLHFLKCRLSTKNGSPMSLFFTGLVPSRSVLCLVILLSCVQSECLIILSLSIGKFHIRYSTRSVSLISWCMLNSPNPTTSIPRNLVFTLAHHHQLQLPACQSMSLGSPIFQTSPFSQITKCTDALAGLVERYFIFDSKVHPAVWWITIQVHAFFHALFLVVATFSVNGYMVVCLLIKLYLDSAGIDTASHSYSRSSFSSVLSLAYIYPLILLYIWIFLSFCYSYLIASSLYRI